jgi:hypothetical protein
VVGYVVASLRDSKMHKMSPLPDSCGMWLRTGLRTGALAPKAVSLLLKIASRPSRPALCDSKMTAIEMLTLDGPF